MDHMANTKEELRVGENLQLGHEKLTTSQLLALGELLDQISCSQTSLEESVCSADHHFKAHSGKDSTEQDKISYFCLCKQVLNNTFSMPLNRQSEMKDL